LFGVVWGGVGWFGVGEGGDPGPPKPFEISRDLMRSQTVRGGGRSRTTQAVWDLTRSHEISNRPGRSRTDPGPPKRFGISRDPGPPKRFGIPRDLARSLAPGSLGSHEIPRDPLSRNARRGEGEDKRSHPTVWVVRDRSRTDPGPPKRFGITRGDPGSTPDHPSGLGSHEISWDPLVQKCQKITQSACRARIPPGPPQTPPAAHPPRPGLSTADLA